MVGDCRGNLGDNVVGWEGNNGCGVVDKCKKGVFGVPGLSWVNQVQWLTFLLIGVEDAGRNGGATSGGVASSLTSSPKWFMWRCMTRML